MNFATTPQPQSTPWGAPQRADALLPGIWSVSTASHGGLMLSDARQRAMPDALRGAQAAYEEDVDWAAVFVAFEDELRASAHPRVAIELALAHDTMRHWRPRDYAAFTGRAVATAESQVLRAIAGYTAVIGEYVATTAFGSWADWVPDGKVGVYGKRVIGVSHLGFAIYDEDDRVRALVDASRYAERRDINTLAALGAKPC